MPTKLAPAGAIAPYRPVELSSDSCEVLTEGSSPCRSPQWAQSAVLLEEPGPGSCVGRPTPRSRGHCIGCREPVPFFEILPSALLPRHPGQSGWLGFRPSCLSPKGGFLLGPWFLLLPAPTWLGRLGLPRPGFRPPMPEASGQPGAESQPYHSLQPWANHQNARRVQSLFCWVRTGGGGVNETVQGETLDKAPVPW